VQLSSVSAVNLSLGCMELKSFSIFCMSDWLGSNIIRISFNSSYLSTKELLWARIASRYSNLLQTRRSGD